MSSEVTDPGTAGAAKVQKVLYFTTIDISLPNGPGINEREFWLSVRNRFGANAQALIPQTENRIAEIEDDAVVQYTARRQRNTLLGFIQHEIASYRALRRVWRGGPTHLLITRQQYLPFAAVLFVLLHRPQFALRHLTGRVSELTTGARSIKAVLSYLFAWVDRGLYRVLVKHCVCADACTEEHLETAVAMLSIDRSRIIIRDNVVNTARFFPDDRAVARRELSLDRFSHIVGFAGGLPYEGGGAMMLALAERVRAKFPGTGFVAIGGGSDLKTLRNEVKARGLEDCFVTPGLRPYEEIPRWVNTFDIGIALDRPARDKLVGNSNQKVRQYIACGVPVCVSGLKGNSFLQDADLGNRIDATDTEAAYAAICRWLALSAEDRDAFRLRAAAFAERYLSASRSIYELELFWNNCLAARNNVHGRWNNSDSRLAAQSGE